MLEADPISYFSWRFSCYTERMDISAKCPVCGQTESIAEWRDKRSPLTLNTVPSQRDRRTGRVYSSVVWSQVEWDGLRDIVCSRSCARAWFDALNI